MAFLVFLITIPLIILMNGIIKQTREIQTIERTLLESDQMAEVSLLDIEQSSSGGEMQISVTIRSEYEMDQLSVNDLANSLEKELNQTLTLEVITLPIIRSE